MSESNYFWISKRFVQAPDPKTPGAFVWMIEKKGRTYVNPENKHRLRGKSALRAAKAARVAQRIELFEKECVRREGVVIECGRRMRDMIQTAWRAAA